MNSNTVQNCSSTAAYLLNFSTALNVQILSYHVAPGAYPSSLVTNKTGISVPTLLGLKLQVYLQGAYVTIQALGDKARVVKANIGAGKSIIHIIDEVLLPIKL